MKFVAVSDNHGNTYYMEEIYSIHQEDTDEWIHCGDSELVEHHPLFQHYKTVEGNMDITSRFRISRVEKLGGVKYLIVHGHIHGVKHSYEKLKQEAKENDLRFVFYGHTHIPKIEQEEGIFFINPGSIAQPRDRDKGTYLVMELDEQLTQADFTFYDRDHNRLPDLSRTVTLTPGQK